MFAKSILLAALLTCTALSHALPEPKAFREGSMKYSGMDKNDGEQFCWIARISLDQLLTGYEATKDPRWLDETITHIDFIETKLRKDPDGEPGWIGKPIYDVPGGSKENPVVTDTQVGDAILLEHYLRFAQLVKNDPALAEKDGAKAKQYVDFSARVFAKWDKRGTYYRCAAGYGSYHTDARAIDSKTNQWIPSPFGVHSENLNKHSAMGIVALRLHQLTGEEKYRVRVIEIFSRLKDLFRYFPADDRISWNFWMPHGPFDVEGSRLASWVGVHPDRPGYQATEISRMVEVYDAGLVFDRADIQRLINTNHYMMPERNGGKWRCSDGSNGAGTLWGSLARFDPLIREKLKQSYDGKSGGAEIDRAYFENVTLKQPADGRLLDDEKKADVYKFPPRPGAKISANVVIPNQLEIANDDSASLVTQILGIGKLTIDLVAKDGALLGRIYENEFKGDEGISMPKWDGTNPKTGKKEPGDYFIRWTMGNESRDEIVRVIPGTARAKTEATAFANGVARGLPFPAKPLKSGESAGTDPADARWHLKNAEKVTALPGGRAGAGLRIPKLGVAAFVFSKGEELPVRISMQVYDDSEKHGAESVNGAIWGVIDGQGEFNGPALFWRKYLGTDANHAWLATAKTGWMSPQYARISRKAGWHEWVFDFTDPAKPTLSVDGRKAEFPAGGLPKGATAVYIKGSAEDTMLFVADVKVEFP